MLKVSNSANTSLYPSLYILATIGAFCNAGGIVEYKVALLIFFCKTADVNFSTSSSSLYSIAASSSDINLCNFLSLLILSICKLKFSILPFITFFVNQLLRVSWYCLLTTKFSKFVNVSDHFLEILTLGPDKI